MSKNKPLIIFEGIEGTGKTTLINHVSRYLNKKKIDHIKIREPGGNKNSEMIRQVILNKKNKFNSFTDLMLYMAARSENIKLIDLKNYLRSDKIKFGNYDYITPEIDNSKAKKEYHKLKLTTFQNIKMYLKII